MTPKSNIFLAASIFLTIASPIRSATIFVNSTQDVIADNGQCTLREAVIAANNNSPSGISPGECPSGNSGVIDNIVLPTGTITLNIPGAGESSTAENPSIGDLDITASVNILGQDATLSTVDAGTIGARVFHIDDNDAEVTFSALEITGGSTSGRGGGIYFEDGLTLDLLDVNINGNIAQNDGGGLHSTNTADLTIRDSRIAANFSDEDGGGISWWSCFNCSQTLLIENTVVEGNSTTGGFQSDGGGIYADSGTFFLIDSAIVGNHSDDDGGGMYVESSLQGDRFTIRGNSADSDGGAIYFDFPDTSFLENCTFSGNSALSSGGAVAIITNDTVTLTNCTIVSNSAPIGSAFGDIDQITLANTIVSGTCEGDPISSSGGNIESPGDNCGLNQPTDQVAVSAASLALSPLANNGGATLTHLPGPNSAAISQARAVLCPSIDQRGVPRPQGAGCEVGAVELEGALFEDGFETGDTSRWSSTEP